VPQDLGGIRHRHHRHLAGRAAAVVSTRR
jgi:hypothetical protein